MRLTEGVTEAPTDQGPFRHVWSTTKAELSPPFPRRGKGKHRFLGFCLPPTEIRQKQEPRRGARDLKGPFRSEVKARGGPTPRQRSEVRVT